MSALRTAVFCVFPWLGMLAAGQTVPADRRIAPPLGFAPAPPKIQKGGAPGRTMSVSGAFRVFGGESVQVRSRFAEEAEQVKTELVALLKIKDSWRHPFVIQLHDASRVTPGGPSVRSFMKVVGGSTFRFDIDVRLDSHMHPQLFRREVLRSLLGSLIIGARRASEIKAGNLVPAWLMVGVSEALAYRREPERSAVATVVFSRGRAFPVERLLHESPEKLPATMRAAYEASACGLILTLLERENGPQKLLALFGDLATFDGDPAMMIRHHFQSMAESEHGLEKWWALQVASMARPKALDFLGAAESQRRIAQAMMVELAVGDDTTPQPMTLASAAGSAKPEELQAALRATWLRLRTLETRVHPLFRGIVAAYRNTVDSAMEGKRKTLKTLATDLARLDARRDALADHLDRVDDYLNWWEVTRGEGDTAELDRFLKALHPPKPPPRKDDPIGNYLDKVERLFE